ncbi:polyketide synthase dehydratase domain-containing protein, partial [Streptomyces sp. MCAF7]
MEHGLLSAAIGTADGRLILTGRLPAGNRAGWLRDHEVAGTILLPASMVMEWALRAADEVGCPTIEELVLQAPVLLDETDPRRIQVTVAAPAPDGRRELLVHSCSEDDAADTDDTWVCHAAGTVSTQAASPAGLAGQWPPPGAEPLDVSGCYERAAAAGLRYGPVFQCLRAAWSDGESLFADVALPGEAGDQNGDFGIHPALLDAALHPLLLGAGGEARPDGERLDAPSDEQIRLPFAWTGVSLHATGAATLRVRLSGDGNTDASGQRLRMTIADAVGTPVLSVGSVVMRPAGGQRLLAGSARGTRGLYALDWVVPADSAAGADGSARPGTDDWAVVGTPPPGADGVPVERRYADFDALAAAVDSGASVPPVVLTRAPLATDGDATTGGTPDVGLATVRRTLDLARNWTARPALDGARLVIVAPGAVARPGEDARPDA